MLTLHWSQYIKSYVKINHCCTAYEDTVNKMILNLRNGREFWNDASVHHGSNFDNLWISKSTITTGTMIPE